MNGSIVAALVGTLAGLHAATWGMYKDAPHEGFSARKYLRSPILGCITGVLVHAAGVDPRDAAALIVLFGMIYAVERAVAEIYKTFLREEDQSKYFIPMQLHVLGRVVQSRAARLSAGVVYTALLLILVLVLRHLDQRGANDNHGWMVLVIGSLGGWISAFGGAWKDAPSEGFQVLKFFRSPLLAFLYAFGLSYLTDSILAITLAATGFTVATTETYKTFFFPSKPRGKFAGRPIVYPEILKWRRRFVPLYVAIWIALASLLLGLATAVLPGRLDAQQRPSPLSGPANGLSMDWFSEGESGLMAMSYRFSSLRPARLSAEIGVSLFPQALLAGALLTAPDIGASYNVTVPGGSLLLKAGGSAIAALGVWGASFVPGGHVGGTLLLNTGPFSGVRVDLIRHHYWGSGGEINPVWSIGLGFAILPRRG